MRKKVSILKERINGENRVILLPKDIIEIAKEYDVIVEENAALALGYTNEDYVKNGAQIVTKEECWKADFIIKYKAPTKEEYKYLNSKTKISAIFHAEGNKDLINEMIEKKITAYTYEFIETKDGFFPMAYPGGEIAGKMAIMYANFFLQQQYGGKGKALFSIRGCTKTKIAIIGYGNVGGAAIKLASELGNDVYVFGSNINKLKKISVNMNENIKCFESTYENLKEILPNMDVIIGAILISTYNTPALITDDIFNSLKPGTVLVDVTCGYGKGYIPQITKYTTLENPVYLSENGIVCCKIDNLPSAYPISTTEAYSRNAKDWILKILNHELKNSKNDIVSKGKIIENGRIVHDVIKEHWEYYKNEYNFK